MKAPDGGCAQGRARMPLYTDIGRASLNEYGGRQPGIRILAAGTGAPTARSDRLSGPCLLPPDGGCIQGRARTLLYTDIGRASLNEYGGR